MQGSSECPVSEAMFTLHRHIWLLWWNHALSIARTLVLIPRKSTPTCTCHVTTLINIASAYRELLESECRYIVLRGLTWRAQHLACAVSVPWRNPGRQRQLLWTLLWRGSAAIPSPNPAPAAHQQAGRMPIPDRSPFQMEGETAMLTLMTGTQRGNGLTALMTPLQRHPCGKTLSLFCIASAALLLAHQAAHGQNQRMFQISGVFSGQEVAGGLSLITLLASSSGSIAPVSQRLLSAPGPISGPRSRPRRIPPTQRSLDDTRTPTAVLQALGGLWLVQPPTPVICLSPPEVSQQDTVSSSYPLLDVAPL